VIAEYIVKTGTATENQAKLALSAYLLNRFEEEGTFSDSACPDGEEPASLAANSTMNVVFGEIDLEHTSSEYWRPRRANERAWARDYIPDLTVEFASENASQIEKEARRLSSDDNLCSVLSGAAYNISYARYVLAGGKRSFFSHPFLAFIRTLYSLEHYDFHEKTYGQIHALGEDILRPIQTMQRLGILRRFPHNPDERQYLRAVSEFAVEAQRLERSAHVKRGIEAILQNPEQHKVAENHDNEYPTDEQIREMFEAWKSNGGEGIKKVLEKRRREREDADVKDPERQIQPQPTAKGNKHVAVNCPQCGGPYLLKRTLRSGIYLECPNRKKTYEKDFQPNEREVVCSFSKRVGDAPAAVTGKTRGPEENLKYEIPTCDVSDDFAICWRAAGKHLEACGIDGKVTAGVQANGWLRAILKSPFLEHLSFRLGNQLFFVRIEDANGLLDIPGNIQGLLRVADKCKGHACLMPMRKHSDGRWIPSLPGWGLQDAFDHRSVCPPQLVTTQKIEITEWELQDLAVQVVRKQIEREGRALISWQSDPDIDPSIWFVGGEGVEWVMVRGARYPQRDAALPTHWRDVVDGCAKVSKRGNFASASFACMETIDHGDQLYRGDPCVCNYSGMTPLHSLDRSS
jgi:hypothetical protein